MKALTHNDAFDILNVAITQLLILTAIKLIVGMLILFSSPWSIGSI